MKNIFSTLFLLFAIFTFSCHPKPLPPAPNPGEKITKKEKPKSELLEVIAFGSCNKSNLPQTVWPAILENKPDLWIWLGDIVYADTKDMNKLEASYLKQKTKPEYQNFIESCPVIGIWDDHDYGVNDGGKNHPKKKGSKGKLLDFLDVPKNNPVWKREGAYQSYVYGTSGKKVKVILLDTRYFRDALEDDNQSNNRYLPNTEGTILGISQWKWLEKELTNSDASVHIVASSFQVLPKEHRFEKWADFPKERARLLRLIDKIKPAKTILISGDRHISEVSKIKLKNLPYPLFEITSSSLTHAYPKPNGEPNQYRYGKLVDKNNFAILKLDWSGVEVAIDVEFKGHQNQVFESLDLF